MILTKTSSPCDICRRSGQTFKLGATHPQGRGPVLCTTCLRDTAEEVTWHPPVGFPPLTTPCSTKVA